MHADGAVARSLGGCVGDHAAEGVVVDELGHGGIGPADGAVRILADAHLAVVHLEGVIDLQAPQQRIADAGEELDGLGDLDGADARAQDAEYAALGARRHHAGGRGLGVEAAIAGAVLGPEDARLPVESVDRAPDIRLAQQHAGVVDEVAGGEVVGPIDDEVVLSEELHDVGGVEALVVDDDVDVGIDLLDRVTRTLGLGSADVALAVDDLALQVGLVDSVELHDPEGADAGRRQVHQRRTAESAGTDAEHASVL